MYEKQQDIRPFKLSDDFLASYKTRKPDFGFNGLGELTYKRTYARIMPDGTKEDWWQTIRRVVEGVYTMQKKWIILNNLGWDNRKAQNSAQEMYERMFSMKFLPSGRGLWAWGTPITEERGIYMALNSCAMVSTENIKNNPAEPFCFLMDASMLGVGVGFDTRGAGKITINTPKPNADNIYQITDDREGWVISLEKLLNSYLIPDQYEIHFDYSLIRPEGEPIKGFGGISNGYKPLEKLHNQIRNVLDKNAGEKITTRIIVDIMNMIGACVVSGNVRRTALISLGEPDDNEFLNLKNYELNPERMEYGWTSNNSIFAQVGMDYSAIAERIRDNGEPGIFWLENARAYSRMCDAPDWKDRKVIGVNPCLTGNTLVAVADGRGAVPIKQLAEEGKDVDVYSLSNDGEIVIRKMRNPRLTGKNVDTVDVLLDSGDILSVTPNHKFILSDGSTKQAFELSSGDSLAIMTRFWDTIHSVRNFPETKPRFEYSHIVDMNGKIQAEHTIIGENKYGYKTPKGYNIHHKDFNCKNNNPDNLEMLPAKLHRQKHMNGDKNPMRRAQYEWSSEKIKDHKKKMSEATSGEGNGRFSGFSNEDIRQHAVTLTKKLGHRFSINEWEEYAKSLGLPTQFSKFRTAEFGTVLNMSKWAAEYCGFGEYNNLDPRTVRYYMDMLKQGYLCDILNNEVIFTKHCEVCGKEFKAKQREVSVCSHTCGNYLSWSNEISRKNRIAGIKKANEQKREGIRKQQAEVYNNLKLALGREPLRKEWENACKAIGLSPEISRKSSPFKSYEELKKMSVIYNHKVVSVTYAGKKDVYNGTVDEFHNFAVGGFDAKTLEDKQGKTFIFNLQCGEQSLENHELCMLVETFPNRNIDLDDYRRTLKFAYLYAKTVTLAKTHWEDTNRVMLRNRRIGLSMSGLAQFITDRGLDELKTWCEEGYKTIKYYDEVYSDWLAIPKSIKVTTVKPSGTVSLLAGATPGIHYPESQYYIRRVRLSKHSDLITPLQKSGYKIEPAIGQEDSTLVVEFPVTVGDKIRTVKELSMWEQLALGAFMQKYWSDNQVSQTVTFDPETEGKDIANALNIYQYQLKGVSFLPRIEEGVYQQMPYEAITKEEYEKMLAKLKPLDLSNSIEDGIGEQYCNNDVCIIFGG